MLLHVCYMGCMVRDVRAHSAAERRPRDAAGPVDPSAETEDNGVEVVPIDRSLRVPRIARAGAKTKLRGYRFTPDVHDGIEELRKQLNVKTKNDALRAVLLQRGIILPDSLFRPIGAPTPSPSPRGRDAA